MLKAILYYVHDPMCSWCWGFSKTLTALLENLPIEVETKRLLGGLAADSDVAMSSNMKEKIKGNWSRIEDTISGVKFNFDFWEKNTPRRSTYPACRAVIAARQQGEQYDVSMTREIQKAYYQEARNPSDNSTLIELANNLGLSIDTFKIDLVSEETQKQLIEEITMARELYVESYPNLVLKVGNKTQLISINYNDSKVMLDKIKKALSI